jgi:uncharacterized metal-binding protein YceD (DUF177 family)
MALSDIPYTAAFDLGLVPHGGTEIVLEPTEAQRAAIAAWLGIEDLKSLRAVVRMSEKSEHRYACDADFEADVVQGCVVTLEPVGAHLSGTYRRLFQVLPHNAARRKKPAAEPETVDAGDDEGPELLENPIVDLAAALLEELSLALEPYPRAAGANFAPPPEEADPEDNPFAVLKQLKTEAPDPAPSARPKPAPRARKSR